MKHKASQDLFAYWNELRGIRMAPERSEIDPAAIRGTLGDTLMLAQEPGRRTSFRLAGTRVCALFGRELKTELFQPLWEPGSRHEVDQLIAAATEEAVGVVAGVTAEVDDGEPVAVELMLLPLFHRGASDGRLIGTLAPLKRPAWLGAQAVRALTLGSWRYMGPLLDRTVVPKFAPLPGEPERTQFVVHDGGRR